VISIAIAVPRMHASPRRSAEGINTPVNPGYSVPVLPRFTELLAAVFNPSREKSQRVHARGGCAAGAESRGGSVRDQPPFSLLPPPPDRSRSRLTWGQHSPEPCEVVDPGVRPAATNRTPAVARPVVAPVTGTARDPGRLIRPPGV